MTTKDIWALIRDTMIATPIVVALILMLWVLFVLAHEAIEISILLQKGL